MITRKYALQLTTLEPFRIGSPKSTLSAIENAVARSGGKVVVQGSSLKGAYRAQLERYLYETYRSVNAMKPCIPSSDERISPEERKMIAEGKFRGAACVYPGPSVCPACYLLGAQGLVGFVKVPYLYTETVPEEQYGVRIDRSRGTVVDKTNRTYQEIPKGVIFTGMLEVALDDPLRGWKFGVARALKKERDNQGNERILTPDKWLEGKSWDAEAFLQEFVIKQLTELGALGGYKSKGFGNISIALTQVK
jgi:CRISPR/Cas system CSM-associated protein Csm3 (group 7 of RAMP superfamily)